MTTADSAPRIPAGLLEHAVAHLGEGVTVARVEGRDAALVYVNAAFERLSGYPAGELLGRDCRLLQGDDRDQPALPHMREAIAGGRTCSVTLRNYRRDGTMFWNQLSLTPFAEPDGCITHYVGIQMDVTAMMEVQATLTQRNAELERLAAMLEHMALTDPLTGVYNRRFFDAQVDLSFAAARRNDRPVAVFMIDVDHFKQFNDEFGHLAGDAVLRLIGESLRSAFARSADVVARYGGEEFAVVCSDVEAPDAERLGDALRRRIADIWTRDQGIARPVTVSVGYAVARPAGGQLACDALAHADACLYGAKHAGRDRCVGGPLP